MLQDLKNQQQSQRQILQDFLHLFFTSMVCFIPSLFTISGNEQLANHFYYNFADIGDAVITCFFRTQVFKVILRLTESYLQFLS